MRRERGEFQTRKWIADMKGNATTVTATKPGRMSFNQRIVGRLTRLRRQSSASWASRLHRWRPRRSSFRDVILSLFLHPCFPCEQFCLTRFAFIHRDDLEIVASRFKQKRLTYFAR